MDKDEYTRFLLCYVEDPSVVRRRRGRQAAQSEMEAPDINEWRVFDDAFFVRELRPANGGGVTIGGRVGAAPAREEALARMRAAARIANAEVDWDQASLDDLIEALERADHAAAAETAGRTAQIGAVILVAALVLAVLWWWIER